MSLSTNFKQTALAQSVLAVYADACVRAVVDHHVVLITNITIAVDAEPVCLTPLCVGGSAG